MVRGFFKNVAAGQPVVSGRSFTAFATFAALATFGAFASSFPATFAVSFAVWNQTVSGAMRIQLQANS